MEGKIAHYNLTPITLDNLDTRSTIIGLVSFGNGCANPGFPGVYARVTEVKAWIQDNADTLDSNC